MTQWNPYEWHNHHKPGKPRWRVKAGMSEERDRLIEELNDISRQMDERDTFELINRWHRVHQAILDCEETEAQS